MRTGSRAASGKSCLTVTFSKNRNLTCPFKILKCGNVQKILEMSFTAEQIQIIYTSMQERYDIYITNINTCSCLLHVQYFILLYEKDKNECQFLSLKPVIHCSIKEGNGSHSSITKALAATALDFEYPV